MTVFNRTDVAEMLAESTFTSEETVVDAVLAGAIVARLLDLIGDLVAEGHDVNLRGFGVFERRRRAPATHRIPGSDRTVTVPAVVTIGFRPSPTLKKRVNDG